MRTWGTRFAETELLLAAIEADKAEVRERLRAMLRGERISLLNAFRLIENELDEVQAEESEAT